MMALTRLSAAQARVLCLHYYSNALGFNFEEDEVDWIKNIFFFKAKMFVKEVYREDKIKEWDPVDPSELEHFLQIIIDQGREHSKSLSLYFYLHGLSKSNIETDY